MKDIAIRRVGSHDIALLQNISRITFSETFGPVNTEENMRSYLDEAFSFEKLNAEVISPDSEFYFAVYEDQVIGYLKINSGASQTELKGQHAIEIERIYVLKAYHGKQAGQLLFEKAIVIARQQNVDYVWLGVWEENPRAIRFYLKNGFEVFDKHLFRLGDDMQTDIMMKLKMD